MSEEEECADLSRAFLPKSDQLNADDLIGASKTITITRVISKDTEKQPVWIYFEGDDGKPWKPCAGMGRILKEAWGLDGRKYKGRQVTLFRNPKVKMNNEEVGGIQISHMSHISSDLVTVITESRGKRRKYIVAKLQPKAAQETPANEPAPTKSPGDITQARTVLASAMPDTVDILMKPFRENYTWTTDEKAEIKKRIEEVKSTTKEVSDQ